jgi:4-hydroxy-3-polyprenylbenzoate decarboxylase
LRWRNARTPTLWHERAERSLVLRDLPRFADLRDFLRYLEAADQLVHIPQPVSVVHDTTEIHRRVLESGGPALVFDRPIRADGETSDIPLVVNLFGTTERVAWGLGVRPQHIGELAEHLVELKEPRAPGSLREASAKFPLARAAFSMRPKTSSAAPSGRHVMTGNDIDLGRLPVPICWPCEPAPLITWPVVVTRAPGSNLANNVNMGVYRMQVLGPDRLIMRWLEHRGGARHHAEWAAQGLDTPVAVVVGADPATILSAVLPLPETTSELSFSGILRGERPSLMPCVSVPLAVPACAEVVIEGVVSRAETAPEGPYGDHTGYYNSVECFPVMRVTAVTLRRAPIFLSTYTGRPPDEPSRIGEVLNRLFVPFVRRQFPEVQDVWLPPDACSYRMAIISIKKRYAGQARRLMLGLWSVLPQMSYTKYLVMVDSDINVRSWRDVVWAISTRADPSRDIVQIGDTPIDYLDFASPKAGLGGKLGIDATQKIGSETARDWGRVIEIDPVVSGRVDAMWKDLKLSRNHEVGAVP